MKMSQRNSLCSYLKQKKSSVFSFTKLENRREEWVLPGGIGSSGRREEMRKGYGR
jgi:hypothetical protein